MKTGSGIKKKSYQNLLSVLLFVHLIAVTLPPLSLQSRGPYGVSPFIAKLIRPLEPYCQFLYIDRGYAFFAPDPGSSHLLQIRVEESSGEFEELFYPDLKRHWPRLLYHRHFMLSEYLQELYRPQAIQGGAELSKEEIQQLLSERERYDRVRSSYSRHLQRVFGGKRISMRRIEHLLPNYGQYLDDPQPLTHPDSYRVLRDPNSRQNATKEGMIDANSNGSMSSGANEAEEIRERMLDDLQPEVQEDTA